ncbi:uncharacterized protein LOC134856838 [Symsagittifera roscoffensis]|uniref:uncharacterized protein LOC134856838 n=1 Tax=Symsagittifera roscoffensis TaxID=84072 RepID=UPI00307B71BA
MEMDSFGFYHPSHDSDSSAATSSTPKEKVPQSNFVNNMMAAVFASVLFYAILSLVFFVIILARYLEQKCCTSGDGEESIRIKFKPEKASLGSGSSGKPGAIHLGAMRIK